MILDDKKNFDQNLLFYQNKENFETKNIYHDLDY